MEPARDPGARAADDADSPAAPAVLKNIGSNWTLNVLQILVFMVLSPFVVNTLGEQTNGVWVSIVSLTGFLHLLILGIPMASVRYVAEHVAREDHERTNQAIATCLGICLLLGTLALLAGGVLFALFDARYLGGAAWSGLGAGTLDDARVAFAIVVATVTLGFAANLPYGIFDAHQEFVLKNLVIAGGLVLRLGLTVALLSARASLAYLALVQLACMASEFGVALVLIRRRHPELRFGVGGFDKSLVRGILSFSVFAMLLNVGARLAFQTDALVIGWFAEPDRITVYDIGNKIFDPFINLILGIGMVVMPTATALMARGEEAELRAIFLKWSKIAFAIVLMIGGYLLVLGPEFLGWWFGDAYDAESGQLLRVLMVSFLLFLPMRGVALPILMGLGRPARPAIALLGMGLLNLVLSVLLIRQYGLVGVAMGTAIPNVLFAAAVLGLTCSHLGVGVGPFVGYVAGRAVIGALLPVGLLVAAKALGVAGFTGLFAIGLAYVALYSAASVGFVFRGDPHVDLYARLRARLRPATEEGR